MSEQPLYFLVIIGIGAVTVVNGWTDAPTAIVSCVSSGALTLRRAAGLAAVCNLLGITLSTAFFPAVTTTVLETVRLPKANDRLSLAVLLVAVVATVVWAVGAWYFGIPTSESHGLLAGLSGAAVAYGGWDSVSVTVWIRVILGLFLSLLGGVLFGFLARSWLGNEKMRGIVSARIEKRQKTALVASASAMSSMHGAQDGQKMIGLCMLAASLSEHTPVATHAWVLPCALLMGGGTLLGGGRIVKTLGNDLTKTGYREGLAADVGAALCLLILTWLGFPVSTTHTKTAALAGAGMGSADRRIDIKTAVRLVAAWLLTFPACFLLGYGGMRIILG